MARPKTQSQFVPPEWTQVVKVKFLNYALRSGSKAMAMLTNEVYRGEASVAEWAKTYGVSGTWIEMWATGTVVLWRDGKNIIDGVPFFAVPDSGETDADKFIFHAEEVPTAKIATGVTRGGLLRIHETEPHLNDWDVFKRIMHDRLEFSLERYRAFPRCTIDGTDVPLPFRGSREVKIPSDLEEHLEEAAAYYFGDLTAEGLANHSKTSVSDRTSVSRRIKTALNLLELPSRPVGRKRH